MKMILQIQNKVKEKGGQKTPKNSTILNTLLFSSIQDFRYRASRWNCGKSASLRDSSLGQRSDLAGLQTSQTQIAHYCSQYRQTTVSLSDRLEVKRDV